MKNNGNENKIETDFEEGPHMSNGSADVGFKSVLFNIFPKTISDLIGRDSDAQNSVVWLVISKTLNWSWWITLILIINDLIRNNGSNSLEIIKTVFGLFIPIITLSLGYVFGKTRGDKSGS